jgi:hypothetical protein
MDLATTAQLLGNFGEFFGAIAVVVTLAYLAVQIRQNTKMMRVTVRQAAAHGHVEASKITADPEVADRLGPFLTGEKAFTDLSSAEALMLFSFSNAHTNNLENTFYQTREGLLDDLDTASRRMRSHLSAPVLRRAWRESGVRELRSEEFRAAMDTIAAELDAEQDSTVA